MKIKKINYSFLFVTYLPIFYKNHYISNTVDSFKLAYI